MLSVKITKHEPRAYDKYDLPIINWKEAGLRLASTARVGKAAYLSLDAFIFKIGRLTESDFDTILEKYMESISK